MTPRRLAVELQRRFDGPHADEHTADAAHLCTETVRFLNYATGSHAPEGLTWPSTAYEVAADLAQAADRMPQLFTQLSRNLSDQLTGGLLATDSGAPPRDAVIAAEDRFRRAIPLAAALAVELRAAQSALSGVNGHGPNRPEVG